MSHTNLANAIADTLTTDPFHVPMPAVPERKLWAAMLEEAVETFRKPRVPGLSNRVQRDAEKWFRTRNHALRGFDWVCLLLGLDADWLRAELGVTVLEGPVVEEPALAPRECKAEDCGAIFTPVTKKREFCGDACRLRVYYREQKGAKRAHG